METKNITRKDKKPYRKDIVISIRISKEASKFLKEKNYSPTLIFYEALAELGFREE